MTTANRPSFTRAEFARIRARVFDGLIYTGDWHTSLQKELVQALRDVQSPKTRKLINRLANLLDETDECVHTITRPLEVPEGLDPDYVVTKLEDGMLYDTLKWRLEGRVIHVTATVRGNLEYAIRAVDAEIDKAVRFARVGIQRPNYPD